MEEHPHHGLAQVTDMTQAPAEPVRLTPASTQAPQGLELRHLRNFAAVADAGTFTLTRMRWALTAAASAFGARAA